MFADRRQFRPSLGSIGWVLVRYVSMINGVILNIGGSEFDVTPVEHARRLMSFDEMPAQKKSQTEAPFCLLCAKLRHDFV
jgi:hypothetical protein